MRNSFADCVGTTFIKIEARIGTVAIDAGCTHSAVIVEMAAILTSATIGCVIK